MEYENDAVICQLLIRRRMVPVDDLAVCAEIQRRVKRDGGRPPSLGSLLVERGLVTNETLGSVMAEAGRDSAASSAPTEREGSSSSRNSPTPEPRARERDGVLAGDRLGPYEVERRLAKGGMGSVFIARDRLTGAPVALKVLAGQRARRDPDAKRFLREARLACALKHDGIVRGLGFGTDRGLRYFAMELVNGESLRQRIKREGPLAEKLVAWSGAAVARALAYAHSHEVVHRDVKPDNILIGRVGDEEEEVVKLCDLGLAREIGVHEPDVTQSGATIGTPRYISPEQARGEKDVDVRSDIYSLGITLWHALAGQPPFADESGIVVMSRHIYDEVPDVRRSAPGVSEPMAELVAQMTKKRREDRPASAAQVAERLERF
jgi:serine/threonine-protein kinase